MITQRGDGIEEGDFGRGAGWIAGRVEAGGACRLRRGCVEGRRGQQEEREGEG